MLNAPVMTNNSRTMLHLSSLIRRESDLIHNVCVMCVFRVCYVFVRDISTAYGSFRCMCLLSGSFINEYITHRCADCSADLLGVCMNDHNLCIGYEILCLVIRLLMRCSGVSLSGELGCSFYVYNCLGCFQIFSSGENYLALMIPKVQSRCRCASRPVSVYVNGTM